MELRFRVKGLDCPNCAAKLERAIQAEPLVKEAALDFSQGTLSVRCEEEAGENMQAALQKVADRTEEGVRILPEKETETTNETGGGGKEDDDEEEEENPLRERVLLIAAAALFVLGLFLPESWRPVCFVLSWLIAGAEVILSSIKTFWAFLKSIFRGPLVDPLDEDLLMTVATIGACLLGEYAEGAMVMLLFNLGEQLQDAAVRRSRASIGQLMQVRPDHANLLTDEGVKRVDPAAVPVGARIELLPGERVPLDGVVLEGTGDLDTRDMTGESLPKDVQPGDEVLSGCINGGSRLVLQVLRPAEGSAVNRVLARIRDAAKGRARTELFFTRFARIYTPVVVGAAALLALVPPLFGGDFGVWVYRALSFLVVSCPCALVLSIPLSFFCGIGGASRRGVLFKGGAALEGLTEVRTVAFDKTGTLTKGELSIHEVRPAEGFTEQQLLRLAASAERFSSHPIARVLSAAAEPMPEESVREVKELSGLGVACLCEGKQLLVGNRRLLEEEGVGSYELAGTGVLIAWDGKYAGQVLLRDTLHEDAKRTVDGLRGRGIADVAMLSGDNRAIAEQIAGELDIQPHAELLPDQKAEILKTLPGKTAFVGDGVNDAPCLLAADVGVAIGLSGADAAIEAADVVLLGGSPAGLLQALDIARATMRNVKMNAGFALGVKGLFLVLSAFGLCPMWLAVFADAGLAVLCVLNSLRLLAPKKA